MLTDMITECCNNDLDLSSHIPIHPKRNKIYNKFLELLNDYFKENKEKYKEEYNENKLQKMAINIERGIFNYALKLYSNSSNLKNTYWCSSFKMYYMHRSIIIYSNLNPKSTIKNTQLIEKLFNKQFNEFELTHFNTQQLFPEKYDQLTKLYDLDKVIIKEEKEIPDGIIKCKKCRSYKTTYYEMQTRSADEPTTKFVTCHKCDTKFKVF